jgi:hypothetical protein
MERVSSSCKKNKLQIVSIILFLVWTSVLVQSVSGATLNLTASWTANTELDMKEYRLYRTDGARTLVGTIPHPTTTCNFSVTVPDQSAGTLTFVLVAVDRSNIPSADSTPASYYYNLDTGPSALVGVFSNGTWYLDVSGNNAWNGPATDKTYPNFGVGLPNAIPVVGDWDGTGVMRIGVFSNGTWYFDMNNNGIWDGPVTDRTYPNFGVGLPNVMPVVGDWPGSANPGTPKIGVFSNGTWYLDMNGNGVWNPGVDTAIANFGVGLPNAKPIVGRW